MLLTPEVKILIKVQESRSKDVRVGQPAKMRVNAYPGRTFEGKVSARTLRRPMIQHHARCR